jgi:hypothetical protein
MLELPNLDQAVVDPRKLTDYLLARSHPVGRSKASFFEKMGFSAEAPDVLSNALREHAKQPDGITVEETDFGTKYVVVGLLRGPAASGRVRSVWIVDRGADVPRFVTAYPGR